MILFFLIVPQCTKSACVKSTKKLKSLKWCSDINGPRAFVFEEWQKQTIFLLG